MGILANIACSSMLKFNNRNTRSNCEICSKLTINTPEQHQWLLFNVFISSDIALISLLSTFKEGVIHLWRPQKLTYSLTLRLLTHLKYVVIDPLLEKIESANTWQISKARHHPVCGKNKCMVPRSYFVLDSIVDLE